MANNTCTGIIANPDLAGIGSRVNFYVTVFLAAVVPRADKTEDIWDSLRINATFYSLALFITAFVQTLQEQLDFYHAMFVVHVIGCFSLIQLYGLNGYIKKANKFSFKSKIAYVVQALLLLAYSPWAVIVWSKAGHFGSQRECNHLVNYVLFFATVPATASWLQALVIVFFSTCVVTLLVIFAGRVLVEENWSCTPVAFTTETLVWFSWFLSVLCMIYGIVDTELIVFRNHQLVQDGENVWGFGQIVSVIMIAPILIEIIVALGPKESESGSSTNTTPQNSGPDNLPQGQP